MIELAAVGEDVRAACLIRVGKAKKLEKNGGGDKE